MVPHVFNLLYYTPAKTMATNEAFAATMLEFVAKATDNENKHLWCYAVYLIDNLEPL